MFLHIQCVLLELLISILIVGSHELAPWSQSRHWFEEVVIRSTITVYLVALAVLVCLLVDHEGVAPHHPAPLMRMAFISVMADTLGRRSAAEWDCKRGCLECRPATGSSGACSRGSFRLGYLAGMQESLHLRLARCRAGCKVRKMHLHSLRRLLHLRMGLRSKGCSGSLGSSRLVHLQFLHKQDSKSSQAYLNPFDSQVLGQESDLHRHCKLASQAAWCASAQHHPTLERLQALA